MQSKSNNTARVIKAAVLGPILGVKMRRSGWPVLVILILLVSGVSSLDVQAAQDTWSGVERIVTIGDVHGDYDRFVTLLRLTRLIDQNNNWVGGKTPPRCSWAQCYAAKGLEAMRKLGYLSVVI